MLNVIFTAFGLDSAWGDSFKQVRGFIESLRHELEGTNIFISVVHPGGVKTNIANNAKIGKGVILTEKELRERKEKSTAI